MKMVVFFLALMSASFTHTALWEQRKQLAFDDVLLKPLYSEITPSKVHTHTHLTRNITLKIPIISAAMNTVTESCLAIALAEKGGIGVIHEDMTLEEQIYHVRTVKNFKTEVIKSPPHARNAPYHHPVLPVGAAIGVNEESKKRITALANEKVDVLVINAIHGHTKEVIELVRWVKKEFPSLEIIAGNVATAEGAHALVAAGADAIKVGIGPGAESPICRLAGVGVPQMSAIKEVAAALAETNIPLIADGGIQTPGDLCKALAAGAHSVMIGSLFCHTQESPADQELYKSSSASSAGHQQTKLNCTATVQDVISQLMNGLCGCMSLIGCRTISEMHQKALFIRITDAAMLENY
jgi:IMP dehydrogenase